MKWYVIHTYSGHEQKVKKNLERAIAVEKLSDKVGRIVIPTQSATEMRNGKVVVSTKKSYPSYVLIEADMDEKVWAVVTNTLGVTHFIGDKKHPQALRDDEVAHILEQMEGGSGKDKEVIYNVGNEVRVIDGPFSDFTGVVEEVNMEKRKLKVMVMIFGRATPVELDFLQVEKK